MDNPNLNSFDPKDLIGAWQKIESDQRFQSLDINEQTRLRHVYYDKMVMGNTHLRDAVQQDPQLASNLMKGFFSGEWARFDAISAEVNKRLTAQPLSRGLVQAGLLPDSWATEVDPTKAQHGVGRGVGKFVEDLTSAESLGLLVGTAGAGSLVGAGARGLGVAAPTVARITRGANAALSGAFAADMAHGTYEGIKGVQELNDAIDNARKVGATKEQLDELIAQRNEALTGTALGAAFTGLTAKHAIRGARASYTGAPDINEAKALEKLGHNPADFVGRLDEVDNILAKKIPAAKYTPPQRGAIRVDASAPAAQDEMFDQPIGGQPAPARFVAGPEGIEDRAATQFQAAISKPAPLALPPAPEAGEPAAAVTSPRAAEFQNLIAQTMKVDPSRINLQKPPDLNGGIEIQVAGKPSGNAVRRLADMWQKRGAAVGKQSKTGFEIEFKGQKHRVRLVDYEVGSAKPAVTPVTEVPNTKVVESPAMQPEATGAVTPSTELAQEPGTVAPGSSATSKELDHVRSTIANYQEALRARGQDPDNYVTSDVAEYQRQNGLEVQPVLPAPLELLIRHERNLADLVGGHRQELASFVSSKPLAERVKTADKSRNDLILARERRREYEKADAEYQRALDYVKKEIDAHERLIEDRGVRREEFRAAYQQSNPGEMNLLQYRDILRQATGKNLRGESGFRGKGYNPKAKDPMKGAEYRDDTRIKWLRNEIDQVRGDMDAIRKGGPARKRVARQISERDPSLNYYPSQEAAAQPTPVQPITPGTSKGMHPALDAIVGDHPAIQDIKNKIMRVKDRRATVLIQGETGVGKELVARALHDASDRANGPFMAINMAAIPETLIESELFGVEKGSFTGADRTKPGLLMAANGGTLFMDEIGSMPLDLQTRLLRVLQERKVRPVGSDREHPVDVRIVAATNADLRNSKTFRPDLYQRLNVVDMRVPSLRERKTDIPGLVQHFIEKHAPGEGVTISPEALGKLQDYSYPGNIRQLENAVERGIALRSGNTITVSDLPDEIRTGKSVPIPKASAPQPHPSAATPQRPTVQMAPPNPASIATKREKGYLTDKQLAKQMGQPAPAVDPQARLDQLKAKLQKTGKLSRADIQSIYDITRIGPDLPPEIAQHIPSVGEIIQHNWQGKKINIRGFEPGSPELLKQFEYGQFESTGARIELNSKTGNIDLIYKIGEEEAIAHELGHALASSFNLDYSAELPELIKIAPGIAKTRFENHAALGEEPGSSLPANNFYADEVFADVFEAWSHGALDMQAGQRFEALLQRRNVLAQAHEFKKLALSYKQKAAPTQSSTQEVPPAAQAAAREDLWSNAWDDSTWYHGTSEAAAREILKTGLQPYAKDALFNPANGEVIVRANPNSTTKEVSGSHAYLQMEPAEAAAYADFRVRVDAAKPGETVVLGKTQYKKAGVSRNTGRPALLTVRSVGEPAVDPGAPRAFRTDQTIKPEDITALHLYDQKTGKWVKEEIQRPVVDGQWAGMDVVDSLPAAKAKLASMAAEAAKPQRTAALGDRVEWDTPAGVMKGEFVQETPKGIKVGVGKKEDGTFTKHFVVPADKLRGERMGMIGAPPGYSGGERRASIFNDLLGASAKIDNHEPLDHALIQRLTMYGIKLTEEPIIDKNTKQPILDGHGQPILRSISRETQKERIEDAIVRFAAKFSDTKLKPLADTMPAEQKLGGARVGDVVSVPRLKAKSARGRIAEIRQDAVRLDDGTIVRLGQINGAIKVEQATATVSESGNPRWGYQDYNEAVDVGLAQYGEGKFRIETVRNRQGKALGWNPIALEEKPVSKASDIKVTEVTPEELVAMERSQSGAIQVEDKSTLPEQARRALATPMPGRRSVPEGPVEVQAGKPISSPEKVLAERLAPFTDELNRTSDPIKRSEILAKMNQVKEQVRQEFAGQKASTSPLPTRERRMAESTKVMRDVGALPQNKRKAPLEHIQVVRETKPPETKEVNPIQAAEGAANTKSQSQVTETDRAKWNQATAMERELVAMGEPKANIEELRNWLGKVKGQVDRATLVDVYHRAIKASLDARKAGEKLNHAEAVSVIEDFMRTRGASGVDVNKPSASSQGPTLRSSLFGLDLAYDWLKSKLDKPQIPTGIERLDKIAEARKRAMQGEGITSLHRWAAAMEEKTMDYFDQLFPLKMDQSRMVAKAHPELEGIRGRVEAGLDRPVEAREDPYIVARNVLGGGGGHIAYEARDIAGIIRDATDAGLKDVTTGLLDLNVYERGIKTVQDRVSYMLQKEAGIRAERDSLLADYKENPKRGTALKLERMRQEAASLRTKAKELQQRINENKVVPEKYSREQVAADMQRLRQSVTPEQFEKVQEYAQKLWDGNRKILDSFYEEGFLGDAQYTEFVGRGDTYVPLRRIREIAKDQFMKFGGQGLDQRTKQKVIALLEGSERVNKDPFEASMDFRAEALKEIQRNRVTKTLVNYLLADPEKALIKEVRQNYQPADGEGVIGYYDGGKQRFFAVPEILATTMHGVHSPLTELGISAFARFTKNVFQKGTTLANLAFAIPNAVRDVQDMGILSQARPIRYSVADLGKMFYQWGQSLKDSLAQNEIWQEYQKSDASFSTLQRAITPEDFMHEFHRPVVGPLKDAALNLVTLHPLKAAGKVIRSIEDLNDAFETATKLTAFKRLKEMGLSDVARDYEVRNYGGSPDFARRGRKTDLVNLMVMFFNANVQGIARTITRVREDPGLLKQAAIGMGLASLMMHSYNSQFRDENGEALWNSVLDTDKQNYFVLLTGEVKQTAQGAIVPQSYKIPKGHVARIIFNPFQETLDSLFYAGSANNAYQTSLNIVSNLLPGQFNLQQGKFLEGLSRGAVSSMNPIVREPLEQASGPGGYDSFRGTPIEPRRLNDVAATEAYVPTTSVTARNISRVTSAIPGLEKAPIIGPMATRPMRIQHAIEAVTGGLGQQTLGLLDAAQGQSKQYGMPLEGNEAVRHMPVVGPVAGRFVGSPIDAREKQLEENFYQVLSDSQTAKLTLSKIEQTEPERVEAYLSDEHTRNLVGLYTHLQKISKELSELRNTQQLIMTRGDMDSKVKKETIRNLYASRMALLKAANQLTNQLLTPAPPPEKVVKRPQRSDIM